MVLEKKIFKRFSLYMDMVAIMVDDTERFELIDNMFSIEGQVWYLVKIGQTVLEKKAFKDNVIL